MAFANSTASNSMADINITPLVDVMLVLLVIFMVTAPMLDNRQLLTLPHPTPTPPVQPLEPRQLTVDAGDVLTLDGVAMTQAQLESALREWQLAQPGAVLKVSIADEADYQSAARAMATAERAGVDNLGLAGL